MYIPVADTTEEELMDFRQALAQEQAGEVPYDRNRWLYVPNRLLPYRYILATKGAHPLICIGINPSTAAPDDLDNTLKSVERVALHNGFDSFVMFNVYAQRATDPDQMDARLNPRLHRENMEAFRYILSRAGEKPTIWAAWGTIIEKRPYLWDCLSDMLAIGEEYGAVWVCAGKRSVKGHPHHPLYLKKDSPLEPFDGVEYRKTAGGCPK